MINYCAYLPHPPIMLKAIGGAESAKVAKTITSQSQITQDIIKCAAKTDLLIIMSPHSQADMNTIPFYLSDNYQGNLGNFGHSEITVSFPGNPQLVQELIHKIGTQVSVSMRNNSELDHGVIVPLYELFRQGYQRPILVVGLNISNQANHILLGEAIAEYAQSENKNILFLGSGDMSHVLKDDGPYGFNPAGPQFDQAVVDLLKQGREQDWRMLDPVLCQDAAECGFRSLLTISGIKAKQPDLQGEVLSYEGPFGVGYLAARWQSKKNKSRS